MAQHVKVHIRELNSDTPTEIVTIDHENADHRKWLGRMCFWAFRNNRSVFTEPTKDPVTFIEKKNDK